MSGLEGWELAVRGGIKKVLLEDTFYVAEFFKVDGTKVFVSAEDNKVSISLEIMQDGVLVWSEVGGTGVVFDF